jgi:hypothetical protein
MDQLTNVALPKSSATLTLRIIKSFEFRTERSLVLHNVNLETTTVGELKEIARKGIRFAQNKPISNISSILSIPAVTDQPGWKPYRNVVLGPPTYLHRVLKQHSFVFRYFEIVYPGSRRQGKLSVS